MIGQDVFRYLPPEASAIVELAQRQGLLDNQKPPTYLAPNLCTVLSLMLAVPSLGYSLLFMPLVWVAQHDRTNRRLQQLRLQLQHVEARDPQAPMCRPSEEPGFYSRG